MEDISLELRTINCAMGNLSRSDGSGMYASGETCVMAAVNGPSLSGHKKFSIDEAIVDVSYRPKVGMTTLLDKVFEATLTKIAEVSLLRSQFPRTVISVVVQEMDNSGGLLACCINALCVALMNSGLPMKFLFASVCCIINKNGEIIVDPGPSQLKDNKAEFTLTMEGKGDIISSYIDGIYTEKEFIAVVQKSQAAAQEIFKFYKKMVGQYSDRIVLE